MVEIEDDMTTAQAILILAEHVENICEPERSFIEAIMTEVVEGAEGRQGKQVKVGEEKEETMKA